MACLKQSAQNVAFSPAVDEKRLNNSETKPCSSNLKKGNAMKKQLILTTLLLCVTLNAGPSWAGGRACQDGDDWHGTGCDSVTVRSIIRPDACIKACNQLRLISCRPQSCSCRTVVNSKGKPELREGRPLLECTVHR